MRMPSASGARDRELVVATGVNMFGGTDTTITLIGRCMSGFPTPFGAGDDEALFDGYDEFVPENLPEPGPYLGGHDLLTGADHVAFHRLTRELFEDRTVYDMTFNYNLARLNLDTRHPDAGYRYAEAQGDDTSLRAEFTPTTPFCPQSHTLTIGSFRAWNALSDRHEYEVVGVRVHPMHHNAETINDQLEALESTYRETGTVPGGPEDGGAETNPMTSPSDRDGSSRDPAPF